MLGYDLRKSNESHLIKKSNGFSTERYKNHYIYSLHDFSKKSQNCIYFVISQKSYCLHTIFIKHLLRVIYFVRKT